LGFITIGGRVGEEFYSLIDVQLLLSLGDQAAIAIENALLYTAAITDRLTGLYDHKFFRQRLREEIARSRRYHTSLALLMVDIDHFKRINDIYGHPVGDKVLVKVANIISANIREFDIAARYGGEEFAIILPETDLLGAEKVAERLRIVIQQEHFYLGANERINLTASVGISTLGAKMTDEGLISLADEYLYKAKDLGRNRVCSVLTLKKEKGYI
jgi:diguanylate cyclase (GGDEF)-like protein